MNKNKLYKYAGLAVLLLSITACKPMEIAMHVEDKNVPENFGTAITDSTNTGKLSWKEYFADEKLQSLIKTALENNQELNITIQEVEMSKNEIRARKGEYLPFVGGKAGVGIDKVGRYTNIGAMEANTEIRPGKEMPEPLFDFGLGAYAHWETDIWGKLHNATRAQVQKYLSTVEGKNFMVTNIISEIANSYYELLALDNELKIIEQNIKIQNDAFRVVKILKQNARGNELAVKRFEAQVLKTQSMQFEIRQKITETENKINYLVGRFPQHVERSENQFDNLVPQTVFAGVPSELIENRADIKQAEFQLAAAKFDVKSAKAKFYPSLDITSGVGFNAYNPAYIFDIKSLVINIVGDITAPIINRNAIKAGYANANARQIQAAFEYEQKILNAYVEVSNQLSKIKNLQSSYELKSQEVNALTKSIDISNDLFKYARADYMEVLLTQRDALEAKFELVETKVEQLKATVNLYRSLGGGWDQQNVALPKIIKK